MCKKTVRVILHVPLPAIAKAAKRLVSRRKDTRSGVFSSWCRWSDSNRHGFPPHFECGASAIPPHRHLRQRHCKYYTTNYARRQDKIEDFPFLCSIKFDRLSGFVTLIIRALPVSKGEKSEDPPSVGKEDTFPLFHFESVSCAPDRFDVLGAAAVLLDFFPNSVDVHRHCGGVSKRIEAPDPF